MLFLFKEKPVEITAFVHEEFNYVKEYSPIRRASEFVPDWYKQMPQSKFAWGPNGYKLENQTGKACVGIITTFQTGFILPMWCDLAIDISEETISYQYSDNQSGLEVHPNTQLPNFNSTQYFCKLISPWVYRANQDIKIMLCEPTYFINEKKEFSIPTTVNQSINKCLGGNLFLFVEKEIKSILIPHGTPLVYLVPLTDKPVKLNLEVVTKNKFFNMEPGVPKISFLRDGLKKIKLLRKQNS